MERDTLIYKVLTLAEWTELESNKVFRGSFVDKRDGFIHLSAAPQLQETLDKHYRSGEDLVLAAVNTQELSAHVKWEVSRGGAEFPHYYAPLKMSHIVWHEPIAANAQGRYDVSDYINTPKNPN